MVFMIDKALETSFMVILFIDASLNLMRFLSFKEDF